MSERKGYIRISNHLIHEALKFPPEWKIEEIRPSLNSFGNHRWDESEMLISGPEFPEVNNRNIAEDVEIIIHKECMHFEVKCIKE